MATQEVSFYQSSPSISGGIIPIVGTHLSTVDTTDIPASGQTPAMITIPDNARIAVINPTVDVRVAVNATGTTTPQVPSSTAPKTRKLLANSTHYLGVPGGGTMSFVVA